MSSNAPSRSRSRKLLNALGQLISKRYLLNLKNGFLLLISQSMLLRKTYSLRFVVLFLNFACICILVASFFFGYSCYVARVQPTLFSLDYLYFKCHCVYPVSSRVKSGLFLLLGPCLLMSAQGFIFIFYMLGLAK